MVIEELNKLIESIRLTSKKIIDHPDITETNKREEQKKYNTIIQFSEKQKNKIALQQKELAKNIDGLKMVLSSFSVATNIAEQINNGKGASLVPAERKAWSFRKWEKEDPKGLENIKNKAEKLYKKMYESEYGVSLI